MVYGLHAVLELLEGRRRRVERIWVASERRAGVGRLLRLAREAGVPARHVPRTVLEQRLGPRAVHQGIAAEVAPRDYADAEEVCRQALERSGMLVLLDGVQDPRNLGSIVRTAAAAGVEGILLGGSGSVGLTPAALKTAAGAAERVPVAREPRPGPRIDELRRAGARAYALDPRGSTSWDRTDLTGSIIVVAGGEARGVRPGLADRCDKKVAIPIGRGVESLNVAVALGVLLFEGVRQRRMSG